MLVILAETVINCSNSQLDRIGRSKFIQRCAVFVGCMLFATILHLLLKAITQRKLTAAGASAGGWPARGGGLHGDAHSQQTPRA